MRKCKRLDLISTIVKDNDIRSKAEIVDYLDKHFGIKYSVATISRDLNELKIYKMPTANNDRCYRKFNGNAQNEAKAKLIAFYNDEIEKVTIKDLPYCQNIARICAKCELLYRSAQFK